MAMSRKRRFVLIIAGTVCGLVLLLVLGAFYALQTTWFQDKVREKIISGIESASGGRVELGSFEYDWRTLTAELKNLTVHGTEPAAGPPLFRADSVRVRLRIISLVKREVDIASLAVEHPEVYLPIHANGTTNIPAPRLRTSGDIAQELLSLKVRHFEVSHGTIQTEAQRIPLSARGESLKLLVTYDFAGPRYDVTVSSHQLRIRSDRFPAVSADLDARAAVEKDRIVLQQIALKSGASTIGASGTVHFAQRSADLRIKAQIPSSEFAGFMKFPELRRGQVMLDATAHYDPSAPFVFNGKVTGHDLEYRSRPVAFTGGEFESDVAGAGQELRFTHLSLSALGSRITGAATLEHFRQLQLEGRISGVSIREIGRLYAGKPLAWSGTAAGPIHIEETLARGSRDFVVQSELQITPRSGGIPVSGNVAVAYRERGNVLELGNSHLDLPSTHLSISGIAGNSLQIALDSTNLDDLQPAWPLLNAKARTASLPFTLEKGSLHFDGTVGGLLTNPRIQGNVALAHFRMNGQVWDQLRTVVAVSASELDLASLAIDQGMLHASGNGQVGLANWSIQGDSPLRLRAQFRGADLARAISEYSKIRLPVSRGIASGSLDISGSLNALSGNARLTVDNLDAYGERVNQIQLATALAGDRLEITGGRVQAGPALISFSGTYEHVHGSWREGQARVRIDSNGFPLSSFSTVRKYEPGLSGQFEIHARSSAHVTANQIEPTDANGTVVLRNLSVQGVRYGAVTLSGTTHGRILDANFSGDLRETQLNGTAQVQLVSGTPVKGELHLGRLELATLYTLVHSGQANPLPVRGFLQGGLTFEGPLQTPAQWRSTIRIEQVQLNPVVAVEPEAQAKPSDLIFHNQSPIVLEASNGVAVIRSFQIAGKDTSLAVSGSIPYVGGRPIELTAEGSLDLRFFELFDPNVRSSGESQIAASISGTLKSPGVTGTLEVKNGSFFLNNFPNGLSGVNGTVRFNHDRATIQKLTAHSGGGDLSLRGFVSFAGGGPLLYHLQASADNVRLRYAGGISVTASSGLRLTGTSKSSLLAGSTRISRIAFNPSTDVGSLLARSTAPVPTPTNESDFLTGLQLDIRVESAPDLQLNTSLSEDVEAEIDLRLRGTPNRPVVLGNISANQGDIKLFGTKYSINRGEVNFVNPVKLEPVLDLDLQTQARGISVDITVSGTLNKLNINYRSDPPLQPRDIVALLTVGRTPDIASNVANVQVTNDVASLQSGANTVLGQAISPASNRLSKLFGITNIKIDPFVQGIITNTPQARLTVEQQMSRDVTITYVTTLSQTSEQIFRFEWALSRQYSVIALRDDNGEFGIDIQYKKRFK
jgi:translocation and assembly module TamB